MASICTPVCRVGAVIAVADALNQANPCERCEPAVSSSAWTALVDGTDCGEASFCTSGACASACLIEGVVHPAQTGNPTNTCQFCEPTAASEAWSNRGDGAACDTGKVCHAASCESACFIDNAVVASGARNAANDCEVCDPALSTTAWTARADDSLCGAGQYCSAGQCVAQWSSVATTLPALYGGSAAPTLDGKIVIFGGYASGLVNTTYVYDPATNMVEGTAASSTRLYRSCATTVATGEMYVMGASLSAQADSNVVQIFTPSTLTFRAGPALPIPCSDFSCATGQDGTVYVFLYDPAPSLGGTFPSARTYALLAGTSTWVAAAPMPTPRQDTVAVTLGDGRIAVMGGNTGSIFNKISYANEIFTPATNTWTTAAALPVVGADGIGALRSDGRVVLSPGWLPTFVITNSTVVYDPVTDAWAAGLPTSTPHRAGYGVTTTNGDLHFLLGIVTQTTPTTAADIVR